MDIQKYLFTGTIDYWNKLFMSYSAFSCKTWNSALNLCIDKLRILDYTYS